MASHAAVATFSGESTASGAVTRTTGARDSNLECSRSPRPLTLHNDIRSGDDTSASTSAGVDEIPEGSDSTSAGDIRYRARHCGDTGRCDRVEGEVSASHDARTSSSRKCVSPTTTKECKGPPISKSNSSCIVPYATRWVSWPTLASPMQCVLGRHL